MFVVGHVHHHHNGVGDRLVVGQCGFDLRQLDPQAAQLHLEVGTADVLEFTVGTPADEVARPVHPLAAGHRVRHETVCAQIRPSHIPPGQLDTGEVQLAGDVRGHRPQTRVENVNARVRHRTSDGDHVHVVGGVLVIGDVDCCLGRSVEVVQPGVGELGEPRRRGRRQRFTAGEDPRETRQRGAVGLGEEHREHRRHEMQRGDATFGDQSAQVVGIAVTIGYGDDKCCADLQGPEELPHRHVERRRRLLHHHVVGRQGVLGLHPQQPVDDRAMADRHALGTSGGSRGVDDVGGVVASKRCGPFLIGDGSGGVAIEFEVIDHQDVGIGRCPLRDLEPGAGGGEHHLRVAAVEHVGDPVDGVRQVDRHVRRAGLDDGVHPDQELERTGHRQGDMHFRSHPGRDQMARKGTDPPGEFRVAQRRVLEHQCSGVGGALHLRFEQPRQRGLALIGGRARLGDHRGEHPRELLRETFCCRAFEQPRKQCGQSDRDGSFGPNAHGRQRCDQFGRLRMQCAVGHIGSVVRQRDAIGVDPCGGGEQLGE